MEQTMRVMVELRSPRQANLGQVRLIGQQIQVKSFQLDAGFDPVSLEPIAHHAADLKSSGEACFVVRGSISPSDIPDLEAHPSVLKVWEDCQTYTIGSATEIPGRVAEVTAPPCPFSQCDCDTSTARGDIPAVADYLGASKLWLAGYKGDGIVVGIVDDGITAQGRATGPGRKIPNVIGGFPADWGTETDTQHGNMTATDAMGMAPNAKVYDIRCIGRFGSDVLLGFQWALNQFNTDGTPQVVNNSWGVMNPKVSGDPNYPVTRKAIEMVQAGMALLFAAGNCGAVCPDSRCGQNVGPGRDIWGVNGQPLMMTVGAVNVNGIYVGYSSAGPAQLSPNKPDFCGVTHFQGYFPVDTGTSAACPIAAGVVALLRQAVPRVRPTQIQQALIETAKQINSGGWNPYTGAGVVQADQALAFLAGAEGRMPEVAATAEAGVRPTDQRAVAAAALTGPVFRGAGQDGAAGANGSNGGKPPAPQSQANPGAKGTQGVCTSCGTDTPAGRGVAGTLGAAGNPGADGQGGQRGQNGGNASTLVVDSTVFKGTITLNFRGGNGGQGGNGGNGGTGQQGQQGGQGGPGGDPGCKSQSAGPQGYGGNGGSGGAGGLGGNGGEGGNGGNGGQVTVIYDPSQAFPNVVAFPSNGLSSGMGGQKGAPGVGGPGGLGGAGGAGSTTGSTGAQGGGGTNGLPGTDGVNGAAASVQIQKK